MGGAENEQVRVTPARSGRPRAAHRALSPDELVRVEVRMPAAVAARLFALADQTQQPVSRTAVRLLTHALDAEGVASSD